MVCGSENPLMVKAELFVEAAVTVTAAPVAVKVPVAVPLEPTVTLPRGKVLGDTLSWPAGDTPVPETGMVRVGFVAVEVMIRFPLAAPAAVGTNETLKVALCPPFKVSGVVIPLTLKPVPVIATCVTEIVVVPVFVIVSGWVPVLPTFTLPKLRLVGLLASEPGVTPVPETGMTNFGLVAVEVTVTPPLAAPAVVGTKDTVKVALCPPSSVNGVAIPLTLKPVPEIAT